MPFLNAAGRVAHGLAGTLSGACLDNAQFDHGDGACWFTETTIIYNYNFSSSSYLSFYDTTTITSSPIAGSAIGTKLFASRNGHWATWSATAGIVTSWGATKPTDELLAMGAGGGIAYRPMGSTAGARVVEPGGNDYSLTDAVAEDICIVGQGQVLWTEGFQLKTYGFPTTVLVAGMVQKPKAALINGAWWITYGTNSGYIVTHPLDSVRGIPLITTVNDYDVVVFSTGTGTTMRVAWTDPGNGGAGTLHTQDFDTATFDLVDLGGLTGTGSTTVEGVALQGVTSSGERILSSTGTFGVAAAVEALVTLPVEIWPSFPVGGGRGRIIHPTLGAFDYEVKPDEWVNIDADAIIAPVWSSTRTLTSAANVLWNGNIRDVVVEERWKAMGGMAMPVTQLRMLLAIWTTPMDPDVGYVQWFPNYITQIGFKVLPVSLSSGGGGIVSDDVVNYLDEDDNPIGWMTAPVTFTMKLVERL